MTTRVEVKLVVLTVDDDPQYVTDSLVNHCEIEGWELEEIRGKSKLVVEEDE